MSFVGGQLVAPAGKSKRRAHSVMRRMLTLIRCNALRLVTPYDFCIQSVIPAPAGSQRV